MNVVVDGGTGTRHTAAAGARAGPLGGNCVQHQPRVAYQGAPGAFSHEACLRFAPEHDPAPFDSFSAAFEAVRLGRCDVGLFPRENSIAGPVPEVAALLPRSGLDVVSEHRLPVRLHLSAPQGAALADLVEAVSHPMALKQVRRSLERLRLRPVEAFDTAGAARDLAAAPAPGRAAVASETAAALYGLNVLVRDLQDAPDNATTFVLVARVGKAVASEGAQ